MNLKETKIYFETLFTDVWNCTPVHFAGEEFKSTDEWINPVYRPLRSRSNGVSVTASVESGQLFVVCWSDYEIDAFGLSDRVITFLKTEVDGSMFRMTGHSVIDNGWNESNKVFVVLSFTFEQFNC